jgi:hypothetical protein
MIVRAAIKRATPKQIKTIEELSVDLTFDRQKRNAHVSQIIERKISYLDELTIGEASKVIDRFISLNSPDTE